MAILFMDSFDHYVTADITKKWTNHTGSVITAGAGRNSTQGMVAAKTYLTVLGGVSEVIVGVAMKPTTFSGAYASTLIGLGSATSWECGLVANTDLSLQAFRVNNGAGYDPGAASYITLLGTATAVPLQLGVWAYVEVRIKVHGSLGTVSIRINGTEHVTLTNQNTLFVSATLTQLHLASRPNSGVFTYDDLVVMDTTGSSNNAFLGDVTVSAILPSGAGNSSGWTPSAGSNYQNVDEATPNNDTDYNSTATLNAKDLYAFADAPAGADIRAVQIVTAQRKASEGPGQIKHVVRSSSTDYAQAAQGIGGTSYAFLRTVVEADPATAAAWSESGFNAAEFGIQKTA